MGIFILVSAVCTMCDGRGVVKEARHYVNGCDWIDVPCHICEGAGRIQSELTIEWLKAMLDGVKV